MHKVLGVIQELKGLQELRVLWDHKVQVGQLVPKVRQERLVTQVHKVLQDPREHRVLQDLQEP